MSRTQSVPTLPTFLLISAVFGGAALSLLTPSIAHAGDDACTTTKFHYKAVEKACKDGGRKAAKEVMKGAVRKAKDAGKDLKCTSCHEDMKSFKLKDNAVGDLKPWIGG
jgi:hypothetical protein